MAVEKLPFGKSLAGLLIDGVEDTPYAGCTLRMIEPSGAFIDVPYIQGDETGQFAPVSAWFSTRTPPPNMALRTDEGEVSLFDIQWSGHSEKTGHSVSLGKLRPTEIVLWQREAALEEPLLVSEVRSHIDGLKEWSRFTAIKQDTESNEEGLTRKLIVEVESVAKVTWQQGGATLTLQTDWRTANPEGSDDGSFNIFEWVVLDSKFEQPQSFFDHLVEQRKVVHLLILVFGKGIHFRKHRVRDDTFAQRLMNGDFINNPFVELISRRTVHEYAETPPTKKDLQQPIFRLGQVGEEGMRVWGEEYETWKRFILPAASILSRRGVFVEDIIISLSVSLESAGHVLGVCEGEEETYFRERPTMATYVYRALQAIDVDWGDRVESIVGLARATVSSYNATKHFNKGEMPDSDQSYIISQVLRKVTRLLTAHIIDPSGELMKDVKEGANLWRVHEMLEAHELRISDDGKWHTEPKPEYAEPPEGITFH